MISIKVVSNYYLSKVNAAIAGTAITRVVKDGENFTPKTADYPFVRFTTMPRESVQKEIGNGLINYPGLIRIDLFYSRALNSADEQQMLADKIVLSILSERVIVITGNQINTDNCWTEQLRNLEGNTDLPIYIRYSNLSSIT